MTLPNPLVAPRQDSTTAIDGIWIAEDIRMLIDGFNSGSWIDSAIGGFAASMDALAVITDPLGSLVSMGVGWLIEHVKPLSDALDWLAGDPDQIAAYAQTWLNVSATARDNAAELRAVVSRQLRSWAGSASDAYRHHAETQSSALDGIAEAAAAIGQVVRGAGLVVALVRQMVRDLIAEFVSVLAVRVWEWLAEEGLTMGLATPLVVSQVGALVGRWAGKIARLLNSLMASIRNLVPITRWLGEFIDSVKEVLRRLRRSGEGSSSTLESPTRAYGGRTTRPWNEVDIDAQDTWSRAAYEDIRMNADADVITGNLRGVPRLDGSVGFTQAEIEQIRHHVFFEKHPLEDYDGGVVYPTVRSR
jgi:uncharacterized protein YukE